MAQCVGFFEGLVQRGGPRAHEHATADKIIADFYNHLRGNEARTEWLTTLRDALRPVLIPETMHGWAYLKPHGYAGDFEIIDRHYLHHITRNPALSAWDHYWHAGAASSAVRNRKAYFHRLLGRQAHRSDGKEITVLNIACGPGRDVLEFLWHGPRNVRFEGFDQDARAVEHATALCRKHARRARFTEANVLKFHPAQCYDVIWSAGLFDYFSDRTFKLLLRRLIPAISPGGQLVIGNFSESNPNHHWLNFCEWHLHHRSESQLARLAVEAGVNPENVSVGREPEGVNLFLHIKRPTSKVS